MPYASPQAHREEKARGIRHAYVNAWTLLSLARGGQHDTTTLGHGMFLTGGSTGVKQARLAARFRDTEHMHTE